jgi:hypothetical protein
MGNPGETGRPAGTTIGGLIKYQMRSAEMAEDEESGRGTEIVVFGGLMVFVALIAVLVYVAVT